jgi:RimJ/RimL family protein N-acetyltransferase
VNFFGYTAETERMRLRPYAFEDFDEFFDLHRRDDVSRFLPWETRDEAAARAALGRHQTLTVEADNQGLTLAGFDKETGRLVGELVLILRNVAHSGGELGYVVHPDFWGRGFAVEGGRHMLGIAFDQLGLRRVIARIDSRNQASAKVLAKLGMRHEAHLVQNEQFKGEWSDEDNFAILASEWAEQQDARRVEGADEPVAG